MFMFAFDVIVMSSKIVDLMLIIFIFLKMLVEMLKIKLNEVNNCRFYLFHVRPLFFKNCCFLKDENVE